MITFFFVECSLLSFLVSTCIGGYPAIQFLYIFFVEQVAQDLAMFVEKNVDSCYSKFVNSRQIIKIVLVRSVRNFMQ